MAQLALHGVARKRSMPQPVHPNARRDEDLRTPEELLDLIEAKGREVGEALAALRSLR